jgi:hypothetical protein
MRQLLTFAVVLLGFGVTRTRTSSFTAAPDARAILVEVTSGDGEISFVDPSRGVGGPLHDETRCIHPPPALWTNLVVNRATTQLPSDPFKGDLRGAQCVVHQHDAIRVCAATPVRRA